VALVNIIDSNLFQRFSFRKSHGFNNVYSKKTHLFSYKDTIDIYLFVFLSSNFNVIFNIFNTSSKKVFSFHIAIYTSSGKLLKESKISFIFDSILDNNHSNQSLLSNKSFHIKILLYLESKLTLENI
jgi:hypothetical protein